MVEGMGMVGLITITPLVLYVFYKVIKYLYKIDFNNYKYRNGLDCPKCGNKMQLVRMSIFDKSRDICNICGFEKYSYKLRNKA